ncbi:acyl-CoA thioesterase [Vibrio vulnificus]|nr:acyl-CoA thioesterase [Vibrio vulnificus]
MELLLQDFPVVTEINVAWGEMDALQHINNVVYFRYFETARIEYFNKINLMDEIKRNQIGPVLSETQCRYRIPVTFPDTLLIGSRVSEVGEDRFIMEYQVVSKKMGKVTTTGSATVVMFDFKNQCKTQLPAVLRDAIFSIEAKKA